MSQALTTKSYEISLHWAYELYGSPNFLEFWFPKEHFVEASIKNSSFSATRKDGEKGLYGMGVGEDAPFNSNWNHFSISANAKDPDFLKTVADKTFVEDGRWDAYLINTKNHASLTPLDNLNSPEHFPKIKKFLEENFDGASTWPGEEEVQCWAAMLDGADEIVAIGALSKWESGKLAAQSIAVNQNLRGKGIGKEFVNRLVATSYHLGYPDLCLGVWHFNDTAKHVYESAGFTLVDEFVYYSKL